MKIYKHPLLGTPTKLVENTQTLPNQFVILLKEKNTVYRVSNKLFCREFINDFLIMANTGYINVSFGYTPIKIDYNESIHKLGFYFTNIENPAALVKHIPAILAFVSNLFGKQISAYAWKTKTGVGFIINEQVYKYPALVSFITLLVKVGIYFTKSEIDESIWLLPPESTFYGTLSSASFYYKNIAPVLRDPEFSHIHRVFSKNRKALNAALNTQINKNYAFRPNEYFIYHEQLGVVHNVQMYPTKRTDGLIVYADL